MMLHKRVPRGGAAPHRGSLSRAQFHNTVQNYHDYRPPANRLVKPPGRMNKDDPRRSLDDSSQTSQAVSTSDGMVTYFGVTSERPALTDEYAYYESSTSWGQPQRSSDVRFPPVNGSPPKSRGLPRRGAKGTRSLPKVSRSEGDPRMSWYHSDGAINLQALNHLTHNHNFPGAKHHLQRLQKLESKNAWSSNRRRSSSDSHPLPIQFLDDDLTPRRRAERESFLATLLAQGEELTDEELNEIAYYFYPDDTQSDVEGDASFAPSSNHASPNASPMTSPRSRRPQSARQRPKSARAGARRRSKSAEGRSRSPVPTPKSVRFQPGFSPQSSSPERSPRRPFQDSSTTLHQDSLSPRVQRRPSDPFHVTSMTESPRQHDHDNDEEEEQEVAYLSKFESPPDAPGSPEGHSDPEVKYFDDIGEEIGEDIATEHEQDLRQRVQQLLQANEQGTQESSTSTETQVPRSLQINGEESPHNATAQDAESPSSEPQIHEHMPDEATPRMNRESADKTPRSETTPVVSSSDQDKQFSSSSSNTPRPVDKPPASDPAEREVEPSSESSRVLERIEQNSNVETRQDTGSKQDKQQEEESSNGGKEETITLIPTISAIHPDSGLALGPTHAEPARHTETRNTERSAASSTSAHDSGLSTPDPASVSATDQHPSEKSSKSSKRSRPKSAKKHKSKRKSSRRSSTERNSEPSSQQDQENQGSNNKEQSGDDKRKKKTTTLVVHKNDVGNKDGVRKDDNNDVVNKTRVDNNKMTSDVDNKESAAPNESTSSAQTARAEKHQQRGNENKGIQNQPIPVISVTRGQLSAVPASVQSSEKEEQKSENSTNKADERKSSTADSESVNGDGESESSAQGEESKDRCRKMKDDRKKIWLTRTSWGRPVECPE